MKNHIIRIASVLLVILSVFGIASAHASDSKLTKDEMKIINDHNLLIHEYVSALNESIVPGTRPAPKYAALNVPLIQQSTTNYCGPACALMVARYLGLVSNSYTQTDMANLMNMGQASSAKIVTALNELIEDNNDSYGYEFVELIEDEEDVFSESIMYSLDQSKPMIFSVKDMPLYYSCYGHFIALKGYIAPVSGSGYMVSQMTINDPHYNNEYYGEHVYSFSRMCEACESNDGCYIRLIPD